MQFFCFIMLTLFLYLFQLFHYSVLFISHLVIPLSMVSHLIIYLTSSFFKLSKESYFCRWITHVHHSVFPYLSQYYPTSATGMSSNNKEHLVHDRHIISVFTVNINEMTGVYCYRICTSCSPTQYSFSSWQHCEFGSSICM
jgi:hypothetical protein